jgi:hypothetical protein
MLRMELKAGDKIQIGVVLITLEHKSGTRARLAITTDHDTPIERIPCVEQNSTGEASKILVAPVENAFKIS